MRKNYNIIFYSLLFALISIISVNGYSQTGFESQLKFNKTTHNFGKISINAGKQQCSFEFTNTGSTPIVINNVISSCGCAEPVWPKEPIMPGKGGKIEVTFLNDQGPYPFEKNLTVYSSASRKPIILRISGIVYEKEKSLKELFPIAVGPLGVMNNQLRLGQIEQGYVKSGNVSIANLSNKDVEIKFTNTSAGLKIVAAPTKIKAGELGEITYTVNTKDKVNWGNTVYSTDVICNGVKASTKLYINTMIVDNVSSLTKEQKNKGAMVLAKNSSVSLGNVAKGESVSAEFSLRNTGASPLKIHKADNNGRDFKIECPITVAPGEEFKLKATIDTNKFKGEEVFTITLITNSPNRPLVNLFVSATIN